MEKQLYRYITFISLELTLLSNICNISFFNYKNWTLSIIYAILTIIVIELVNKIWVYYGKYLNK